MAVILTKGDSLLGREREATKQSERYKQNSYNPVGITNANGRYKNLPFFFIFQGFQRVRMLRF